MTRHAERVREVDRMRAIYPLSVLRRIERQWAARINLLKQIPGRMVVAAERTLQQVFSDDSSLIPIPVRVADGPRRLDRARPRD